MSEATFNVAPTTPKKRPLEDDVPSEVVEVKRAVSLKMEPTREDSPAPSMSSSLTELTGSVDPGSAIKSTASPSVKSGPSKKRKIGFFEAQAEKAAKQREKDDKARQKAEEKARKEEEKARKDEEKRKAAEEKETAKRAKELERAEKQKAKDEEKQKKDNEKALREAEKAQKEAEKRAKEAEKEADKQRKEAEKLRKERSQMRLGAFFVKPKAEDTPPSTPDNVSEGASSRRSSVASIAVEKPVLPSLKHHDTANPEYEKYFLPFYVPEFTDVAPVNRLKRGRELDFEVTTEDVVYQVHDYFPRPKKRARRSVPVKQIIEHIQATGLSVVDLDDSNALEALAKTPFKCLQFHRDVRPPYEGTYTRRVSPRTSKKLSRNPFSRELPDTNYDYDSEAEWEPPAADDEDLDEEDEMSDADEGGEDMNDFLDDVDDVVRKKGLISDMEPISSGLCWVGHTFDDNGTNLEQYRMDFLHDSTMFPINPYSDQYWADDGRTKVPIKQESSSALMQPPRQPLSSLSPNSLPVSNQSLGVDGKPLPVHTNKKATTSKIPKMIDPDLLEDFKQAVDGSDLTKLGLIEILKKQFPQCSKDVIKDTLAAVAVRVGKKEIEKKWQLIV